MADETEIKLTEKQKRFCEFYIVNWNASDAARKAGYSKKTAYSIGEENLRKPELQAYIAEIQKDISKIAGISALSNINDLIKIKNESERDGDKIRSIEVINKMLGYNEPDKIDQNNKHSLDKDTETFLKKLNDKLK